MSGLSDQHGCLNEKLKLCKKTHIDCLRAKKFALDVNIALEEMFIDLPYIFSNIHIRDENTNLPFGYITYSCKNHMNEQFSFEIEFKLVDFSEGFHGVQIDMTCLRSKTGLDAPLYFKFNFGTLDLFMLLTKSTTLDSAITQPTVITFQSMIEIIHHEIVTYFLSKIKHTFQ
jgi:hypothetical protein